MTIDSLCERCVRVREVISGKGSRFLLCRYSAVDARFPKYPPQPVRACGAFVPDQPDPASVPQAAPISLPPE
jgi:hypothetical protein